MVAVNEGIPDAKEAGEVPDHATKDGVARARLLAIYLNDHLAGATAAVELVRRAANEHRDTELGSFLSGLAVEIAEDRQALRRIMSAVGARPDPAKVVAAWIAEKAGRFKLNGQLFGRSPLSALIELEIVKLGIYGKMSGWQVLREQRPPGSTAVDLEELIARAERQLTEVEEHRILAGAALHE